MLTWGGGRAPAWPTRAGTPRRLLAGALLALLVVAVAPPVAYAGGPGGNCPPGQDDCSVWDDDPGIPGDPGGGGGPDGGGGPGDSGGGGTTAKCQWNGAPLPCYNEFLGWFNNGDGCYYKLEEPQPAGTPEGKQWYLVTCNGGNLGDQREELRDAPPPGFGAPPDPEELARRAFAKLTLRAPRASVAPRRREGAGLVGLPVWMWASPGPEYFGPQSADASDRGLTVTITAKVDRILWNMGNGDKKSCPGAGTPYSATGRRAGKTSPTCGYDTGYTKAGSYRISATTYWSVHWTSSGGDSGDIPQTRTSNAVPIDIDELQVVAR
ncbi:hypothetical protein ACFY3U_08150 [Micromonospora sp. NPDC000089]|uniref:hypothetical protein n=1 Tax=unclassified Micromonospora TaxID=2617518 RepID=UPI0036B55341